MTKEYSDYLAHYGVKGQKWGVRNWQNEDGTYTDAGKNHYGWGYGYQNRGSNSVSSVQSKRTPRAAQSSPSRNKKNVVRREWNNSPQRSTEQRKAKTRKILLVAAGLTVAGIAAYKGSTAIRNKLRNEASSVYQKQGFYKGASDMLAADKYNRRTAVKEWIKTRRWR